MQSNKKNIDSSLVIQKKISLEILLEIQPKITAVVQQKMYERLKLTISVKSMRDAYGLYRGKL
jgi:hypothetical protein